MSAATRALLADATSSLEPVTCSPYFRVSTKPGDAFVRLDRRVRDDSGLGYMDTWQVCVLLDQDQGAAEKWIDQHSPDLAAALEQVGIVTTLQPVQLTIPTAGTLPALIVTVIREQE